MVRSHELVLSGYFLSRLSVPDGRHVRPPLALAVSTWKEAYEVFYPALGCGRSLAEFRNTLKNSRDMFDGHVNSGRVGWRQRDSHDRPVRLSSAAQRVHDEWHSAPDTELWEEVRGIIGGYRSPKSPQAKPTEGKAFWVFGGRPEKYKVLEACQDMAVTRWKVDKSNPKPGDLVAIWQFKGKTGRRGVVGLAEVIGQPTFVSNDEDEYWVDAAGAKEAAMRVELRQLAASRLPLWESEYPFLSELSVARSTGGTVFRLSSDQWRQISEAANLVSSHSTSAQAAETDGERILSPSKSSRQGYVSDAKRRQATELHAMRLAREWLEQQGFKVSDVSATKSYDLHCLRGPETLFVEVKGTSGDGLQVIVTENEMRIAESEPYGIVVVSGIGLQQIDNDFEATGGTLTAHLPFVLDRSRLKPLSHVLDLTVTPIC